MKQILPILLCCILLFSGCSFEDNSIKEPVTFYYPRSAYAYHTENPVMSPEIREALGHTSDLSYLISLYLAGPVDEKLRSPFPVETKLFSLKKDGKTLYIELTDSSQKLSDAQFSLACACFSRTCIELSDVNTVVITSGSRELSTSMGDLLLLDDSTLGITSADGGTAP